MGFRGHVSFSKTLKYDVDGCSTVDYLGGFFFFPSMHKY